MLRWLMQGILSRVTEYLPSLLPSWLVGGGEINNNDIQEDVEPAEVTTASNANHETSEEPEATKVGLKHHPCPYLS